MWWCRTSGSTDGRPTGEDHPAGPYERLWPREQTLYRTLGFGPHLFPDDRIGAGDAEKFQQARAAASTLLAHLTHQPDHVAADQVQAVELATRMRTFTDAASVCLALDGLVRAHVTEPGLAFEANHLACQALDSCLTTS